MDKFIIQITKGKTQLDLNRDPDDPAPIAENESSPPTKKLKLGKTQLDSNCDPDDPAPIAENESSPSTKNLKLKMSSIGSTDLNQLKNSAPDDTLIQTKEQWPSVWSFDQWMDKKGKYPWLFCSMHKIGCIYCKEVGTLKTFKKQGVEISKEWSACNVDCGSHPNKKNKLSNLRNKIKRHVESQAHEYALTIKKDKESQRLVKNMEAECFKNEKSTEYVFRTAYFIAKYNRPYDDHQKLIELQKANGVHLGSTLHSRYSSTSIVSHIASKMRERIVKNIIESGSKLAVLIDESTTLSSATSMIVYIKTSISNEEPIFIFLDLIELFTQNAENIVNQLLKCLHECGFNDNFLKENWISFVSDGASVLLGKRNGVAKRLKDIYPLIFTWHCLNHRLELAVNDSVNDITSINHFKAFLDSLYALYNRSPKNQNELKKECAELDVLFLKIGRVLTVRWVASSFRAVQVIWKTYPALYQHLSTASKDDSRDTKSRSKYLGLCKRLESIEFVLDLALMCDVLLELSNLSKELQSHRATMVFADQTIKRTIRVIESFKTKDGEYTSEAKKAKTNMVFKNITLFDNQKLRQINQNQFLSSVCNNLQMRLLEYNNEDSKIICDIQILNKCTWPKDVDIRFGEQKIKYLTQRFLINTDTAIRGMRKFVDNDTIVINEELKELDVVIKTLPVSTAECERVFSLMNLICSDLRSRLTIQNISNLMFINVNGPPLSQWNPTDYVKSWLFKHRSADDNRSRKVALPNLEKKDSLWKIL